MAEIVKAKAEKPKREDDPKEIEAGDEQAELAAFMTETTCAVEGCNLIMRGMNPNAIQSEAVITQMVAAATSVVEAWNAILTKLNERKTAVEQPEVEPPKVRKPKGLTPEALEASEKVGHGDSGALPVVEQPAAEAEVVEQVELDRSRPWAHPLPEEGEAPPTGSAPGLTGADPVAAFLAKGGTITKCPPSRRKAA